MEALTVRANHLEARAPEAAIADGEIRTFCRPHGKRLGAVGAEQELSDDLIPPQNPHLQTQRSTPLGAAGPRLGGFAGPLGSGGSRGALNVRSGYRGGRRLRQ